MIKRPMIGLAVVWLLGIYTGSLQHVGVVIFLCCIYLCSILIFIFLYFKQHSGITKYQFKTILPRRYLQLTIYLILLPSLLIGGFFRGRFYIVGQEGEAFGYQMLESLGETQVFVSGTVTGWEDGEDKCYFLEECTITGYDTEKTYEAGGCRVVTDKSTQTDSEVFVGNRVRVYGKISFFRPATNPGQFDMQKYYYNQGIFVSVSAKKLEVTEGRIRPVKQWMQEARYRLSTCLQSLYEESKAGVLAAMLLGEKELLSEEVETLYQQNGISHILAISGLHVSILCMGLFCLLRRTGISPGVSSAVTLPVLLFYVVFTGAGTSSLRAGIMCMVMILGKNIRRSYDLLSALSLAAILVTFVRPGDMFQAGFLLSFLAVCGVAMAKEEELSGKKLSALCFGAMIQIVTLPVSLWFFFEYSPYSLFLNLVILPLASFVLAGGMCSVFLALFSLPLGKVAAGGVHLLLSVYEGLGMWTQKLPYSFVLLGRPELWRIFVYYAAILFVFRSFRGKRRRWLLVAGCVIFLLWPKEKEFSIHFLDVSQGDGILVQTQEGTVILSDCGSSDVSGVGKYRLSPVLKLQGISMIDMVVVSHMDSDHTSGIKELLEAMPKFCNKEEYRRNYKGEIGICHLVLPKVECPSESYLELEELARQKGVRVSYAKTGSILHNEGTLILECLSPEKATESENDTSLVLLLQTAELAVWLMGDAELGTEDYLLQMIPTETFKQLGEKTTVLKVGHHGSKTSSGKEFLLKVAPDISVISCGYRNRYGHPHPQVTDALLSAGSKVYRTDETGAVEIRVGRKKKVEINLQRY